MTQPTESSRARRSAIRKLQQATCGMAIIAGFTGCTNSPDKDTQGMSATQVCDSTLDATAAAAAERMADTKKFTELTGTNDAGEPNKFSLSRAIKHLHGTTSERSSCSIYKADDQSGHPLLDVDFSAAARHPKPKESHDGSENDRVVYPIGLYAITGSNGATLFFRCPTKGSAEEFVGDTQYVKAAMFAPNKQLRGNSVSKDQMAILVSLSRQFATRLGCGDVANLPSELPNPE